MMVGQFLIIVEAIGWIVLMKETSKFPCPTFRSS
jgi:hypothetical protein